MLTNQGSSLSVELQFGSRHKLTKGATMFAQTTTCLNLDQGFAVVPQYCTAARR